MLQILRYNWPFYVVTAAIAVAALVFAARSSYSIIVRNLVGLGALGAMAWASASLLVSHYIYDRSNLRNWQWIAEKLPIRPTRWVNIHAGLDETSASLRQLFPEAQATILDIYDPREMSEPSIARARQITPARESSVRASFFALPLQDNECDVIFVIFSAHEIRNAASREQFFRELSRALKPQGVLLMVEHLRDVPNYAAFSIGAFHFLPHREWLRLLNLAHFEIEEELKITLFVRIFLARKSKPLTEAKL